MTYSWSLPSASSPAPAPSGPVSSSSRTVLGGLLDQYVDPVTLDFVDTDDGGWAETSDSRSIVLCQLEIELGRSYTTPADGTEIKARLETGDPVTTAYVEGEVLRALGILVSLGIIGAVSATGRDAQGNQLYDETGRAVFQLAWTDLATGSPVDATYRPLGG